MTKYLTTYRRYILAELEREDADLARLIEYHEKHLAFFMHERLVHLLVMILFALLTMACFLLIAVTEKMILVPLAVALMCLLIPYIKHYYFLENTVQALYKDYDRMRMKLDQTGTKELYE